MVGRYARHLVIGLAPSLPAIEGQRERKRLAHVVGIGRAEWIIGYGGRLAGERKKNKLPLLVAVFA